MSSELARQAKRKYQTMIRHRDGVRNVFRLLSKFVLLRQAWFGDQNVANARAVKLSVAEVSYDTPVDAARAAATALGGALWPNSEESFEIIPNPLMRVSQQAEDAIESEEVQRYYAEVTRRLRQPFASEESNWLVALSEHFDEQVVMGTSGIICEETDDADNPCYFRCLSVETTVIDENAKNRVDCFAVERTLTIRQLVDEYGLDSVSPESREKFKSVETSDDYVRIVQLVEPRLGGKYGGVKSEKPIASIHLEIEQDHVLRNDGMDEQNGFFSRFRKRPGELYGRSLAMDALPTIKQGNVITRASDLALGKQLDPPVGFRVESLGGAGTVDISMGAKVPLYDSSHVPQSRPPVEKLIDVPEPRVANERLEKIEEKIMVKFLLDKLLDFANKTRMTLGEAQLRNDFRNQALGNIFARQMVEILQPCIMWVARLYWRRGMLGLHPRRDAHQIALMQEVGIQPFIMPDVVADFADAGKFPFAARFVSPAARAMAADALLGIEKYTNYVMTLVSGLGAPEAADNLDIDEACKLYRHHVGAPPKIRKAKDKIAETRKARAQAQQQMAELQMQEQQSQIAKNAAKAQKDASQANVPLLPQGVMNIGA